MLNKKSKRSEVIIKDNEIKKKSVLNAQFCNMFIYLMMKLHNKNRIKNGTVKDNIINRNINKELNKLNKQQDTPISVFDKINKNNIEYEK